MTLYFTICGYGLCFQVCEFDPCKYQRVWVTLRLFRHFEQVVSLRKVKGWR